MPDLANLWVSDAHRKLPLTDIDARRWIPPEAGLSSVIDIAGRRRTPSRGTAGFSEHNCRDGHLEELLGVKMSCGSCQVTDLYILLPCLSVRMFVTITLSPVHTTAKQHKASSTTPAVGIGKLALPNPSMIP